MMANSQAVLAIVRAVRPKFRNRHDKLAFALHAAMLADGYKLLACGEAADTIEETGPDAPEVGLNGWTDLEDSYAFVYSDASGRHLKPVMIKSIVMGDTQVVHALRLGTEDEPKGFNAEVGRFTTDSPDPGAALQNVDELLKLLRKASEGPAAASAGSKAQATPGSSLREEPRGAAQPDLPARHPGFAAPDSDLLPAGIPRDITGVPGLLGRPEPLSGAPSGMHMGPHDPLFEMRSRARPGLGLPEGPFPGVRYDPVNPQGLEGFNAQDFQRNRPPHPDIMPPGRGGGPDFDSMFG